MGLGWYLVAQPCSAEKKKRGGGWGVYIGWSQLARLCVYVCRWSVGSTLPDGYVKWLDDLDECCNRIGQSEPAGATGAAAITPLAAVGLRFWVHLLIGHSHTYVSHFPIHKP